MKPIIKEIGEEVFKSYYKLALVFFTPTYCITIIRMRAVETPVLFIIHTSILIMLLGVVLFYHNLSFRFKVYLMSFLFFIAALAGLYNFGLNGGHYVILFAVGTLLIFGEMRGWNLLLIASYVVGYVSLAVLLLFGVLKLSVDLNSLVYNYAHWISNLLAIFMTGMYFFIFGKRYSEKIILLHDQVTAEKEQISHMQESLLQFVSVFSHDLKNSLGAIHAQLKFINKRLDTASPEKINEQIKFLESTAGEQSQMLQNVLLWSRYQVGNGELEKAKIHIRSILSEIEALFKLSLKMKNITLRIEIPPDLYVNGSEFVFHMAFRNFVDNAIKFSHMDSEILISAQKAGGNLIKISVTDFGIGMTDDVREKLFDFGNNYHSDGTFGEKGTGYGLKLVYTLVKKMGCDISIKSALGEGTTFEILCSQSECAV